MAEIKISQLPAAASANGTMEFETNDSGTSKKVTGDQLKTYATSSLGTISTQNANSVSITGGSITGITDLAVADGGTGASTLTGYVKGNGTSAFTASSTIPNTDITGLGTMSTQAASSVAITGGSINGTTVGATTASTGAFTTLSASSTVSGTGFSTYLASPPAIGGTAAAAGSFTTLSASGNVTLSGGTANGVLYLNGSKVATSGSALVFDGTNLGIGTSSPGLKLDVNGAARLLAGNALYFQNASANANGTIVASGGSGDNSLSFNSGALLLNASGNLGLGTTSLSGAKLCVYNATAGNARVLIGSASTFVDPYSGFQSGAAVYQAISSASLGGTFIGGLNSVTSGDIAASFSGISTTTAGSEKRAAQISIALDSDSTTTVSGRIVFNTASAGTLTERMRIDSSGNVGIGTSSPASKLHVKVATDQNILTYTVGADDARIGCLNDAIDTFKQLSIAGSPLLFRGLGGVERARITSAGEFWVAGTTDQGAYNIQCNGTGVWGAGAYVNGSDERIKDDIAPIESGLDVVEKLNPVTYRYKEDWSKDQSVQTGFIAQELLVALEGKNYVDGVVQQGGSEGYYSVAYQNIIPILTKAIQELNAKVEAQAAEIEALKGN